MPPAPNWNAEISILERRHVTTVDRRMRRIFNHCTNVGPGRCPSRLHDRRFGASRIRKTVEPDSASRLPVCRRMFRPPPPSTTRQSAVDLVAPRNAATPVVARPGERWVSGAFLVHGCGLPGTVWTRRGLLGSDVVVGCGEPKPEGHPCPRLTRPPVGAPRPLPALSLPGVGLACRGR